MNNDNLLSDILMSVLCHLHEAYNSPAAAIRVNGILDYRIDEEREGYIQSEREVIIRYLPLNYDRKSCY